MSPQVRSLSVQFAKGALDRAQFNQLMESTAQQYGAIYDHLAQYGSLPPELSRMGRPEVVDPKEIELVCFWGERTQ